MTHTPNIRPFEPQEWVKYKALRLQALADSPDAFGATLDNEQARSNEEWSGRLAKGATSEWELPLVAEVNGEPVGLTWGRIDPANPEVATLYQVWVAPTHRGLGIGKMLMDAAVAWAKSMYVRYVDLGVTWGDTPATRLYLRTGFEPVGQPQPLRPGSELLGQRMQLKLK